MNSSMKQKQTHRHRGQTCGCQGGGGVGSEQEGGNDAIIQRSVLWEGGGVHPLGEKVSPK